MQSDHAKKDLIRKYINRNCTAGELEELKKIMLLPNAQQLFDEVLSESWTGFEAESNTDDPNLNAKLKTFYGRLEQDEKSSLKQQERNQEERNNPAPGFFHKTTYLRYAAVIAFAILGIGIYTLYQPAKLPMSQEVVAMMEQVNANGQRSIITLPDNSEVFLGAGSKLSYPEKFKAGSREVHLEGEAFFQVTKNPKRPFIIHTGSVQTKVLGTSFRIQAFKNHPIVVSVVTGKVKVDHFAGKVVTPLAILTPGQQVSYVMGNALLANTDVEEVRSWKEGRLVFRKRKLEDITTELERWYNVKIKYRKRAKADEKISIVLQANIPLNNIMKVLSATGHFSYQIHEKTVTIN